MPSTSARLYKPEWTSSSTIAISNIPHRTSAWLAVATEPLKNMNLIKTASNSSRLCQC